MSKDSWSREKSALFALDDQRVSSRREIFVQIRFVRTPFHDPCVFLQHWTFHERLHKRTTPKFLFRRIYDRSNTSLSIVERCGYAPPRIRVIHLLKSDLRSHLRSSIANAFERLKFRSNTIISNKMKRFSLD